MVKTTVHTFQKMTKDISESKSPIQFYYDAHNIRFITNQEVITGGFAFEKGNDLVLSVPSPSIDAINLRINYNNKYLNYSVSASTQPRNELEQNYFISNNNYKTSERQQIIGHTIIRNNIILFTTDNKGFDCIWKVNDETYELELLYLRNLNFNTSYPIQALSNYENDIIDKIYWVDGRNQMMFVNIYQSVENQDLENLIDLSFNNIQMVGTFNLNQPKIIDVTQGGIHTAGVIQYAYNLYRINGSQTKISPLSELVPLDKGNNGGGAINEIVGSVPVIKIENIDKGYTNLRLYAIKYTSYNQLPNISLILDRDINSVNEITYYDDGNIIQSISLEEFLFLGSDIIIPKHINTKNNIMFLANYREKNFDINTSNDIESIDTRAFSFKPNTTTTTIYKSLALDNTGSIISNESSYNVNINNINGTVKIDYKHPAININYDLNNRQYNNSIIGGEGAYLKYKIIRNQIGVNGFTQEDSEKKFFKDNEIYRLAIQFYNKYGQNSLPKWIADFKNIVLNNESNLNGYYSSLEITFKPLFYIWLNNPSNFLDENGIYDEGLKPIGYKLLRAERTLIDRTILVQGLLNGMMSQINGDTSTGDLGPNNLEQQTKVHNGLKIPSMMRRFDDYISPMWGNRTYFRIDRDDSNGHPQNNNSIAHEAGDEVFARNGNGRLSGTYQFNKLMQMFSPDITFNTIQNLSESSLQIVGGIQNSDNKMVGYLRDINTKQDIAGSQISNAISVFDIKATGNVNGLLNRWGYFGPRDGTNMEFIQTYREYLGTFYSTNKNYPIYGIPEITETGQGRSVYNQDSDLTYYNSLEPLLTDSGIDSAAPNHNINSVNSWGAKSITLALGTDNILTKDRIALEQLYNESNINDPSIGLIGELRISNNLIYLGNIYGGNSYESKKRSNYIEIGNYQVITNDIYLIKNPGDTFISNFQFTKLVKTDTEIYSETSQQLTEIVNVKLETTIDLKNRNDQSVESWDNRFQPRYNEYQQYNTVYSQDSNLIIRRDTDYKFKKINAFDTNVIATKTKTPGEIIDSWTDLLANEVLTLDGKYGPINNLISWKDELYTFQDRGIAGLSIQPRVQVQGSDGISVELGTGRTLAEYKYLTTNSGSINKWGILSIESGIYYLDALNKSFNVIGSEFKGLSDTEGFHKYFLDNIELESLKIDNPILYRGVSLGWDKVTNDIYLSLFKSNNTKITLAYNLAQGFSSFYDYHSSIYIYTKGKMLTINPNTNLNNNIYECFIGNYNYFYDINKKSSISFILNPEPNVECTFNNLEYKSEALNNNRDEVNYTWERIQAYNEFQDTGLINLENRINLRKLNRKWRLNIPRDNNKVNRIRNTWTIITLESNNLNSYNYRNHDIITYYNPNYKIIQ